MAISFRQWLSENPKTRISLGLSDNHCPDLIFIPLWCNFMILLTVEVASVERNTKSQFQDHRLTPSFFVTYNTRRSHMNFL